MRFLQGAREGGVPVLFDPNLRPNRWTDLDRARELVLDAARGARLLKTNLDEARWLAAAESLGPEEAPAALLGLGVELAVVTAGPAGAFAAGIGEARATAPDVRVRSPLGAGDAFMGSLAAGLTLEGWSAAAVGGALEAAVTAGARACEHLGAID
jgi:sugar/nucleoside kinase (ribokinase family)